jgi:hypothetical protein
MKAILGGVLLHIGRPRENLAALIDPAVVPLRSPGRRGERKRCGRPIPSSLNGRGSPTDARMRRSY